MAEKVLLTDEAAALLRRLTELHGPLMFHQSGGCCDGSSPMCYPDGEFKTGSADVQLGDLVVDGLERPIAFWMSANQYEYWKHTQLTVDVVKGRGIQAGRVWTNCYHAYPAHAAFGGYKQSGIGRETHKMMLEHYQQTKNLLVSYSPKKLGFF